MDKKKTTDRKPKSKEAPIKFMVKAETELMKFLTEQMPGRSRTTIKSFLRNKQVFVEGKAVSQFDHVLQPGQYIEIGHSRNKPETELKGLAVVFEDDDLIVIDKPAGLLAIATAKEDQKTAYHMLSSYVKRKNPANKIFVVHRLDRETSGLVMYAKNEKTKKLMQDTWNDSVDERTYLALVEGRLSKPEGTVRSYLRESTVFKVHSSKNPEDGQLAITHYQTMKNKKTFSLLKVNLETGRKNQIRVHMSDLGAPVVGDKKYGSRISPIGRMGLHAWVLAFTHPVTGKKHRFQTEIPPRFLTVFK